MSEFETTPTAKMRSIEQKEEIKLFKNVRNEKITTRIFSIMQKQIKYKLTTVTFNKIYEAIYMKQ